MGDCTCIKWPNGKVSVPFDSCPEHGTISRRESEKRLNELDRHWVRKGEEWADELARERAAREKAEAERDQLKVDLAEAVGQGREATEDHLQALKELEQAEARLEQLRGEEAVERAAKAIARMDWSSTSPQDMARAALGAALLERGEG